MIDEDDDIPTILCPLCGAYTQSTNAANICTSCLRTQVDITEGISKQVTIFYCKGCSRYQGKDKFVPVALESRELLALCLKKINGISKEVKLIDASFVWTEPHSMRIKVKLVVQKSVYNVIMQQTCIVEFVVAYQQCNDCKQSFTEHTWTAVVQVRQKAKHKRTFFWIEQQLLKHRQTEKMQKIAEQPDGLDFFFTTKSNAESFVNFITNIVPVKKTMAKRLVSSDLSSNVHKFKFTFLLLVSPICKDDLIILPSKVSNHYGGVGPFVLCTKVTTLLRLTDPHTLQTIDIDSTKYFRYGFNAALNAKSLTMFIVLDIEKQSPNNINPNHHHHKFALAEVTIVRESDFGVNDRMYTVMTHLGNILKHGDHVLGYDLEHTNLSSQDLHNSKNYNQPDVILVRKTYPDRKNRARHRKWKLKQLDKIPIQKSKRQESKRDTEDYEAFLQDIEEDPEVWKDVPFVPAGDDGSSMQDAAANTTDDGFPGVELEQMLSQMNMNE